MAKKKIVRHAANVRVTYLDSRGNPLPPTQTVTGRSGTARQSPASGGTQDPCPTGEGSSS